MKKTIESVIALVFCLIFCLCLVACGGENAGAQESVESAKDTSDSAEDKVGSNEESEAKAPASTADPAGEDLNAQIQEYIEASQDLVDQTMESMESVGVTVIARDGSLVYRYQYKEDFGIDNDMLKEMLDSTLDETESIFTLSLEAIRKDIPKVKSLIVEYLDANGDLITNREYK